MVRCTRLAFLLLLPSWPSAFAATMPAYGATPSAALPAVSATVVGPEQTVYDTRQQSCDQFDGPDTRPRAFRDDHNMVHLISTGSVNRAMVGPDLNSVKQDCRVLYRPRGDVDPAHFQDQTWLTSFFTADGRHIAALAHTEYHGLAHPGMCAHGKPPEGSWLNCWWNTIAFAQSDDSGYSFSEPKPPGNLVASLPYQYDTQSSSGPNGYFTPSNILKVHDDYYATITANPYKAQKFGACLLRTSDPFNPSSWRGWDGKAFSVRFVDPYTSGNVVPEQHVCTPVSSALESLVVDEATGLFLATQLTALDQHQLGPPGVYVSASPDLIHWSKPILLLASADMIEPEPSGKWRAVYVSLLDPVSHDRNFRQRDRRALSLLRPDR